MPFPTAIIAPLSQLLDRLIPDRNAREKAQRELLSIQGGQELRLLETQLRAIVAEAGSLDPWTSRARPAFLYVMYILILWSLPMGVLAAFRPVAAEAVGKGMTAYLAALPDALYALFGTGYLGYTAARQWGKVKGVEG